MKRLSVILWIMIVFLAACTLNAPKSNEVKEEVKLSAPQETGWEQAEEMILSGKVETLTQAHDRTVILGLKDGSQLTTKEPTLDEIFKVVEKCGAKCSEITIATE